MAHAEGPVIEYAREGFVHVEYVVYLASGDTHLFPSEEWARWFKGLHDGSSMLKTTRHTYEGLHAGQRQSPAKGSE